MSATPTHAELQEILRLHAAWLRDNSDGQVANLRDANLRNANLSGADLRNANLSGADLRNANLFGANLRGANLYSANLHVANLRDANLYGANLHVANLYVANLYGANLRNANLSGADLRNANLSGADLRNANLFGANLRDADLYGANLRNANLRGAKWFHYQIPQEGDLIVWKSLQNDGASAICKLRVPSGAKRTATLIGRKCRAECAWVLSIEQKGKQLESARSRHQDSFEYRVGELVKPDAYDPDPRVECTSGIHFFLTREEAEQW